MNGTKLRLSEFNGIVKENDEMYHNAAKAVGLSDCAFWILYFLQDSKTQLTQREICAAMYAPKQTVNSALKKLENSGYVELLSGNDHRSKLVRMTKKGVLLASQTVDRILSVELEALNGLTAQEQETFLALFRKYTDLLKNSMPGTGTGME